MSNSLRDSMITTENRNDRSDEIQAEQIEVEPVNGSDASGEFTRKLLTTLPCKFKSLRGIPITVDSDKPVDLIELLGSILEITDYTTNMASFWFLDMLALQILYHRKDMDEHYLGVLISWLIGEIMLIRDGKYSRDEFFKEMKEIFMVAVNKVPEWNRLLYWDEVVYDHNAEEGIGEEETQNPIFQEESTKNLQKRQTKGSGSNVKSSLSQETTKFSSNIDPLFALNKVIESTYDMYANELQYELVYAVFVEPIETRTYNLPFAIRTPRPTKLADKSLCFNIQLRENMKNVKVIEKAKKSIGKRRAKAIPIPATPAPSMDDEEMLMFKRSCILPLLEANEAFEVFESQSNIV